MSEIGEELIKDLLSLPDPREYKRLLRESNKMRASEKIRSRVYFIQAENVAIKIGFTLDVERRFKRMQMDCPIKLYLIGMIKGERSLESKIHKKFKKHRKRGEWFEIHESIVKYIKENTVNLKNYTRLRKFLKT